MWVFWGRLFFVERILVGLLVVLLEKFNFILIFIIEFVSVVVFRIWVVLFNGIILCLFFSFKDEELYECIGFVCWVLGFFFNCICLIGWEFFIFDCVGRSVRINGLDFIFLVLDCLNFFIGVWNVGRVRSKFEVGIIDCRGLGFKYCGLFVMGIIDWYFLRLLWFIILVFLCSIGDCGFNFIFEVLKWRICEEWGFFNVFFVRFDFLGIVFGVFRFVVGVGWVLFVFVIIWK